MGRLNGRPHTTPRPYTQKQITDNLTTTTIMIHVFQVTGTLTPEVTEELAAGVANVTASVTTPDKGDATDPDFMVFYIDSPGGSVAGVKELATLIAESPLQTVAVVGDLCASAAYWLASQCDQIWAISPTARIGSVGGMVTYYRPSPKMAELWGEDVTVYAPQSTAKNAEAEALRNGDPEPLRKSVLEPLTAIFINDVFRGRAGRLVDAQDAGLASGVALYASEALGRGWIDKILGTRLALRTELKGLVTTTVGGIGMNTQEKEKVEQESVQADATQVSSSADTEELEKKVGELEHELAELRKQLKKANPPSTTEEEQESDKGDGGDAAPKEEQSDAERPDDGAEGDVSGSLQVAPVSGVGVLQRASDLLTFAEHHADNPLAIVERLLGR